MNPIQAWKNFQDNSPYFQAVRADGEESAWQEIAADYDNIVYPDGQKEQILSRLIPLMKDAKTAIEIGAGPGTLTVGLSNYFEHLTVIEPSPSMVGVLKQRLNGSRVSILQSKWEDVQPEPADVVIAGGCLYAFYDIDKVLLKMLKYAKSKVLITHFGNDGLWDFDHRLIEKLSGTKPCLFPSLSLFTDVLVQLKIPANTELFFIRTRRNFSREQWINGSDTFL